MATTKDWTPEQIALLGTMPDNKLAEQLGLTADQVYNKRKSLGKKPFAPPGKPPSGVKSVVRSVRMSPRGWEAFDLLGGSASVEPLLIEAAAALQRPTAAVPGTSPARVKRRKSAKA